MTSGVAYGTAELAREITENIGDHKALIFSQFLGMLALIREIKTARSEVVVLVLTLSASSLLSCRADPRWVSGQTVRANGAMF